VASLESLANLGEIIGAIAVVVSLIYLAIQVRQNTQAQRTENFSRALDRVAAMQATLSQDADTAVILSKGLVELSKLTHKERIRFTFGMYELFGAFEFMFLAAKDSAIPEEVWQRWSATVAWWLSYPGVQAWWAIKPAPFTGKFESYVKTLLENNPTDPETARRYDLFVADGRRR
jgi:hypothetical protein